MSLANELQTEINQVLGHGKIIRIKHYTISGAVAGYDDDVVLSQSGTDVYTSGLVFPLRGREGSSEAVLLQQGKLFSNDQSLFINGSVNVSGTLKIGLGSPVTGEYQMADPGVQTYSLEGTNIYHKIYIRHLPTGSLVGES